MANRRKKPYVPFALKVIRFLFSTLGKLFPQTAADIAYTMWFQTQRFKSPEREHAVRRSASRETLDAYGVPLQIYRWGEGERRVLVIHGWSGRATQFTSFITPLNAAGFEVIGFDAPAHGETPGRETSVLQFGDAINRVIEEYGPFHAIITHSFGGMALAYAMSIREEQKNIICICPPDNIETLMANYQRIITLPDEAMRRFRQRFANTHSHQLQFRVSTESLAPGFVHPALIIHDEDDQELDWHCGERVADAWTGSTFIKTQGLGHHRILRNRSVIEQTIEHITTH